MPVYKRSALPFAIALLTLLSACRGKFDVGAYPNNEALYVASVAAFEQGRNDHAITGFERLTLELSARDTLLPRSHAYLAQAHARKKEWLLSAGSWIRLQALFPDDTMAPRAMLEAGQAYERLWRKPELDPQYGHAALDIYGSLLTTYPNTTLRDSAFARIEAVQDKFALKDFENGMHYYRRRAFDSAIMSFKDVIERYSDTPTARRAYIQLVRAYRELDYTDDAREVCNTLGQIYPGDAEIASLCSGNSVAAAVPAE
jgi:outer membrane assembly lipoprotein YfiO